MNNLNGEIKSKKILLVNMGGIGDIIMMTPALRAIRQKYSNAEISFLGISRTIETAQNLRGIDKFYAFPITWRLPKIKDIFLIVSLVKELRCQRFDYSINFRIISTLGGNIKIWALNKIINAKYPIGRAFFNYGKFYKKVIKEVLVTDKNETELAIELLEPLGICSSDRRIDYPVKNEDVFFIERELRNLKLENNILIGFNPGAFRPFMRWPSDKWIALAKLILKKYKNVKIIINCSTSELKLAKQIKFSENVIIADSKYNIGQIAALLQKLDVLITNNTGPMHLAAAVGTKIVGIFRGSDLCRFTPSVPEKQFSIVNNDSDSLDSISVEAVMSKFEEMIPSN
ncbi:MAG: glycosyltransferase family 9 protein [Elusimicrobia bacterium]|nr:glycosyltransferase family 9 protein [Elusimicrobiota bacterium]